jgi:hypothetical protein
VLLEHSMWTTTISPSNSVQIIPPWWLTCVYGPQRTDDKIQFLQELRDIRAACSGPWILVGDFNLIYKDEDKSNSNYNRAMMGHFRKLIDDLALKEVLLHGRKYTWSNQQEAEILVKLDRVLCSVDWEDLFPNCLLQPLPHAPWPLVRVPTLPF